ncbi:MAG: glycosyltransferase family 4 protein [Caulobacter sp.]|nr:glycosyltransferase family 4 protein [Caulobacter sp.]
MNSLSSATRTAAFPSGAPASDGALRRVVLIGSFPPRLCGIATFTADVHEALTVARPGLDCRVVTMVDDRADRSTTDPAELCRIRQERLGDYLDAAAAINALNPDVVCVQHEFGLFGGPAGDYLLTLLDVVRAPVVCTLHTLLTAPNGDQRRVMDRLIQRSSRLIVMAERGRQILTEVWGAPAARIQVIAHGAPDQPMADTAGPKAALGLAGREVMLTFGLLSPGKGLETVIAALPQIVATRPGALYVILGASHPNLVAREGEAYRDSLAAMARTLGVSDHVLFVNRYVDRPELLQWLAAADLYVTPYLSEAQITSGTLSYAVALGKAVISTPYWHAQELLADGRGLLVPFHDHAALARAATGLLSDPVALAALRQRAWERGRETLWSRLAEHYLEVFSAARTAPHRPVAPPAGPTALPRAHLGGLRRMTDSVGMLQHSVHAIPDRNHGYCVDDNARALLLVHRLRRAGHRTPETEALAHLFSGFVHHAWNGDAGRFRNFMAYDRSWLEPVGSDDSVARAWWSVAVTAAEADLPALRRWARELADRILPHLDGFSALRTHAFLILGLTSLVQSDPGQGREAEILLRIVRGLAGNLETRGQEAWFWFEDRLTYDNARLPEALIRAGMALSQPGLVEAGLAALEWLCRLQTGSGGVFRPVGAANFGRDFCVEEPFDQQPLEAAATVDACAAAFLATGDARWMEEARRAFDWFLGANDLGMPIADPLTGDCYDGLTARGPNLNQGAESVLSFQLALCALQGLERLALPELGPPLPVSAHSAKFIAVPALPVNVTGAAAQPCPIYATTTSELRPTLRGSSSAPSTSFLSRRL